ncbi:hypothetical protein KFE98_00725 [bacterium SCSIO 12741]|nr:hypothetical protein KFE98_00725 [bacterium SCSIO 12741]
MIRKILLVIVVLLLVSEIVMRFMGMGNPVLYMGDRDFEYILVPNQKVKRFGNLIETNSLSQRNPEPVKGKITVLKIGDSIINGGDHLSNNELSSNLLKDSLNLAIDTPIQVLNISAGSWGPENGAAYLKRYGTFDAKVMILVYSSHDRKDFIGEYSPIEVNINYPIESYSLAWVELIRKKLVMHRWDAAPYPNAPRDPSFGTENQGFRQLKEMADRDGIQVLGYLHPTREEVAQQQYEQDGLEILEIWKQQGVPTIQGMNYMTDECYRDFIHLNALGNQKVASAILPKAQEMVQNSL